MYHRDGRVKYVQDGLACLALLTQLSVQNGAFVGDDALYDALPGREWQRDAQLWDRDLSAEERKSHGPWDAAARERQLLLEYGRQFHKKGEAMGVFLPETPSQTVIRAAYVSRLVNRSRLFGGCILGDFSWRLVGVAPEALNVLARKYPQYAAVFVSHADEVKAGLERYFASTGQRLVEQLGRQETGNMLSGASVREQKQEKPYVEVKSKSGFLPGRENDIKIGEAGNYVHEDDVLHAVNIVESGGKYPAELVSDLRKTLERNLRKGKEEKNE